MDHLTRTFRLDLSALSAPDRKSARDGLTMQDRQAYSTLSQRDLFESEGTFETLVDAMPQIVWSTLPDGYHDFYNRRWYEFTGVPDGSTDGEGWAGLFHPEDQPLAWARWRHSLETGETYEVEYRLRHHTGTWRWTLGRALPVRDAKGNIVRWIGTCTDIDETKCMAAQNELLSRELSHRIKNIFQVVSGLISLSARRQGEAVREYAVQLRERVAALGRAHEFARPHSDESRPVFSTTSLRGMLHELFAAYEARDDGRIEITGEDALVDDRGATPIALLIHELATNAVKYGSLSNNSGRLQIHIETRPDNRLSIHWRETGGPALAGPPERAGFGSRLVELSIGDQLGGTMDRTWHPDGLEVQITVQRDRIYRG